MKRPKRDDPPQCRAEHLRLPERQHVLAVGPLPPPLDGPSVSFESFCKEIEAKRTDVRLAVVDTSPKRLRGESDAVTAADVWRAMRIAITVCWHLPRTNRLLIFGSNGFLARMAPLLVRLSHLAGRPCFVRPFGGSLDRFSENLPERTRHRLLRALASCRGVVVQTRLLQTGLTDLLARTVEFVPGYRMAPQSQATNRDPVGSKPALRLVYLGHVRQEKGIFVLLEALRQLSDDEAVHCDIYGPIYDSDGACFEEALEATAAASYRGVLPRTRVSPTLGGYDALVFPTHYPGEGHPGVVIEAMLAGLPIITTRFRSLPELVEGGVNGLLVPVGHPPALADAIRTLSSDRELLRRMAAQSRIRGKDFEARVILPELFQALGFGPGPVTETAVAAQTNLEK